VAVPVTSILEVKLVPPKLLELLVEVIAPDELNPTVDIAEVKVVPPKLLELLVLTIAAEEVKPVRVPRLVILG
jgi:hypothetical protein